MTGKLLPSIGALAALAALMPALAMAQDGHPQPGQIGLQESVTPIMDSIRTFHDGILVWTKLRVSNGALEGMNNKVKVISHRAYGYRTTWTYMANIYHCCAAPPLP